MNIFTNVKRCLRNSSVRQRVAPTSCADIYDRWYIYDIFLMFCIQWIILPMHCNDKSGWVRSRADLLPRVDLTFSGSLSPSAVTPQDIARHFVNPEYLLPKIFQNIIKPPDMEFVKNFTHPDFQAKSFTPQKCVICDSFFAN